MGPQITADYQGQPNRPAHLSGWRAQGRGHLHSPIWPAPSPSTTHSTSSPSPATGRARVSSGAVRLIKDIDNPIENRHVILVRGHSSTTRPPHPSYLRGLMLQHKPASLRSPPASTSPADASVPIEADYVGFQIPNEFVIGYGMDFAGNLPQRPRHPPLPRHPRPLNSFCCDLCPRPNFAASGLVRPHCRCRSSRNAAFADARVASAGFNPSIATVRPQPLRKLYQLSSR